MFKDVDATIPFSKREDDVTSYWKENGIFEKSVSFRPDDKKWTFLDGPPFVTGMPHYGSLLSSLPKDLFGRYWTMKGYKVRRVWGWDGHGLPIENKVEGKLHIKRKRDIEEIVGVDNFDAKVSNDEWNDEETEKMKEAGVLL
jgi:isoleucyl-tRNA synthetase